MTNLSYSIKELQLKKINFEQTNQLKNENINVVLSINAKYEKSDNNLYKTILSLLVELKDDDDVKIFHIDICVISEIELTRDINNTKELSNVYDMLLSYMRPIVHQICGMSMLPPINLPNLNHDELTIHEVQ